MIIIDDIQIWNRNQQKNKVTAQISPFIGCQKEFKQKIKKEKHMNEKTQENIKTEDSKLLYEKLAEGISSMKSGEIYTIEEAWQEIDQL